jgi:hypothetical protein
MIFRSLVLATAAILASFATSPARASEGGASFYLLGSGGPEAAVMPPLQGVYLDNTLYEYTGSAKADQQFQVGGNIVAGLHATTVADFPIFAWVPTTHFLGGTLMLGGAPVVVGAPIIKVSAVLTGPFGNQFAFSRSDNTLTLADPVATAALGWAQGNAHEQLSTTLNIPIGFYYPGQLANISFHRWIDDVSLALTWHDAKAGWDLSGKAGVTFNGTNPSTQYTTGTESHFEASLEKTFSPKLSAAVQAYYFNQVSGDSRSGAGPEQRPGHRRRRRHRLQLQDGADAGDPAGPRDDRVRRGQPAAGNVRLVRA